MTAFRVNNFTAVTRELLLNELLHDTQSCYRDNRFYGFLRSLSIDVF